MSTAYVFPGQGSQSKGMGAELFSQYPDLIAEADAILGYSLQELCLEDARNELNQTQFTQPALYVVNALSWLQAQAQGATASFFAGHSLGEYNALLAAGVFDFATGLRLVQKRGQIMARVQGGGMAAVLNLEADKIQAALTAAGFDAIDVANFNSPKQIVLSGLKADIVAAETCLLAAGAKRYVVLPVSGAFHSRYMAEPQKEFAAFASASAFKSPATPVVANFTALPYTADILSTLSAQISGSVRWVDSVQYMKDHGVSEFIECGPGKVLSGLIRQM